MVLIRKTANTSEVPGEGFEGEKSRIEIEKSVVAGKANRGGGVSLSSKRF